MSRMWAAKDGTAIFKVPSKVGAAAKKIPWSKIYGSAGKGAGDGRVFAKSKVLADAVRQAKKLR